MYVVAVSHGEEKHGGEFEPSGGSGLVDGNRQGLEEGAWRERKIGGSPDVGRWVGDVGEDGAEEGQGQGVEKVGCEGEGGVGGVERGMEEMETGGEGKGGKGVERVELGEMEPNVEVEGQCGEIALRGEERLALVQEKGCQCLCAYMKEKAEVDWMHRR